MIVESCAKVYIRNDVLIMGYHVYQSMKTTTEIKICKYSTYILVFLSYVKSHAVGIYSNINERVYTCKTRSNTLLLKS